ncbi:hypothetical protein VC83_04779 [Pseudogymnoascus destructans]|uniref:Uncharacterized protein n=2 Tax=Pseudogymnoascus destructans TaxID=655981 RepID=L8G0G8_PSED2|nr:uncharacterized protein VC83_04779 [Pseudogymnoascus destructans]ELR06597.1 hypothetical protein GMDG_08070 [Pseudogymnoascus destructans 20631-21]OAF57381.1 hypothetical protein VC83_04779 [Pseudogymnoascus destructans]
MQSRVVYGNVYGNCTNVRRRQVASALTFGELRPTCISARRAIPRGGDQAIRWASLSSADAVKVAHQSVAYEQPLVEARQLQPITRPSSDYRPSTPDARSVSPTQQSTTEVASKSRARRNRGPTSRAIVASKFRTNRAPNSMATAERNRAPISRAAEASNLRAKKNRAPNSANYNPVSLDVKKDNSGLEHTSVQSVSLLHSSKRPNRQVIVTPRSNRQLKSQRPSPGRIITAWQSGTVDFLSGEHVQAWSKTDALTSIFVRYMKYMESPYLPQLSQANPDQLESLLRPSAPFFTEDITASLQKHGCTPQDVRGWAWIVLAPNAQVAAQRYLSADTTFPPVAILTNILRMKKMHIKILRKLVFRVATLLTKISNSPTSKNRGILEDNSFQTVVCGLLRHAREIDPLSFTGIARLVSQYCGIVTCISDEARGFGGKEYTRLTNICRTVICRLSIPAAKSPYASMGYAWEAQQVILEAGNSLQPALELDARSYCAIACVLLAGKKTEAEAEAVAHLHRSWPPWKKVLDGMDARRQPEDDASRATRVLENMKAAGYPPTSFENAISILAGRDTDGTPAIPTRTIMSLVRQKLSKDIKHNKSLQPAHKRPSNLAGKQRSKPIQNSPSEPAPTSPLKYADESTSASDGNSSAGKSPAEWAARIRATRDVQEAWAAFRAYQGLPSQAMFHEMFLKLIYDKVNRFRPRMHHPTVGDGLEVFPVENDNFSDFEIERKAPPDVRGLYELMRAAQLTAAERTLRHLLTQADSLSWALRLLLDSGIPSDAVSALVRGNDRKWRNKVSPASPNPLKQTEPALARVPPGIFTAHIKLLARLSLATPHPKHPPPTTHLHTILALLKAHPSPPDSAWHAFLRAAAAPKTLAQPNNSSPDTALLRTYNHRVAPYWNAVVRETVAHLRDAGGEVSPDIFQYAAYALYSTIFAARRRGVVGASEEAEKSLPTLHDLWDAMAEPSEDVGGVGGELVHQVMGVHILSYIRVLAVADCDAEIERVLAWVVRYQAALGVVGRTRGNGVASLRRVVVAVCAYSERRDAERERDGWSEDGDKGMTQRLMALAEEIEDQWGGWPGEGEVSEYFREGKERYGGDFGEGEWVVGGLVG